MAAIARRAAELQLIGADIDAYQDKVSSVAEAGIFGTEQLRQVISDEITALGVDGPTRATRIHLRVTQRGAARLTGANGVAGVASYSMASDMLCCPGGISRSDYGRTGPGPDAAAPAESSFAGPRGSRSAT